MKYAFGIVSLFLISLHSVPVESSKPAVILPDTSLVGVFYLRQYNSPAERVLAQYNAQLIDEPNDGEHPHVWVCNNDTTEFAQLVEYEGDSKYQFSKAMVTTKKPAKFYRLKVARFVTENAIQLGVTRGFVEKAIGKAHWKDANNNLFYSFGDKSYYAPGYDAIYQFRNDSLVKFSFGYIYL